AERTGQPQAAPTGGLRRRWDLRRYVPGRHTRAAVADLADELLPGPPQPQSPEPTAVQDGVRGDLVDREDEGLQAGAEQARMGGVPPVAGASQNCRELSG